MSIFKKLFGSSRKPNIPTPPQQKVNPYRGQIRLRINNDAILLMFLCSVALKT